MKLKVLVDEKSGFSPGLGFLGRAAIDVFGPDAEFLAGTGETRMKGGMVSCWRLLLLDSSKLLDLTLTPTSESDHANNRAQMRISTYPLRHMSTISYTADTVVSQHASVGNGSFVVHFVPGCGLMDLALPPQQEGLNMDADDAAGYRKFAACLLKTLA